MSDDRLPGSPRAAADAGSRVQERVWAGSMRVAIAIFCVVVLPWVVPAARAYRPALLAYLVGTVAFQIAIARNVGGAYRAVLGAMMDIGMTTFIVHRLGSTSTPFVASYCLLAIFYALVTPTRVAIAVTVLGAMSYAAVCYAEALGMLSFAPDFHDVRPPVPTLSVATASVLVLSVFVFAAAAATHRVALTLRRREQELVSSEQRLMDANLRLQQLSQRDPLTQLFNRRYLVLRVEEELSRVRRGSCMALLMIDLDGFKTVNDAHGHLVGDELLKKISTAMLSVTREVDVVGRYGGDEFVVMLVDTTGDQVPSVAERLVEIVRKVAAQMDLAVTASVGVARAEAHHDVTTLLSHADAAAYCAKREGGDCVRYEGAA